MKNSMCQNDLLFAVCENNVYLNHFLIKVCIQCNITLRKKHVHILDFKLSPCSECCLFSFG